MVGIIFVVLAGLCWAVDTLIRYPLLGTGVSAERIVFAEHLILTLIFLPVVFKSFQKFKEIKLSSFLYFFVIGGLGSALATFAFTKAFTLINPSLVILLQKLQPIVAFALARVFLGEKIGGKFLLWAGLALFGGFLISSPDILPGLSDFDFKTGAFSEVYLIGYGLTFVAVLSWGASTVFGKKLTQEGFDEKQIMGGRFIMGFITICVYLLLTTGQISLNWDLAVYSKIFVLVFLSGLLAMYLFYRGLKTISARSCVIAEMFFPFSAVVINWVFLDAKLLPIQILGAVLLVISSIVIQYKKY